MTRIQLCSTGKYAYPDAASAWRRLCEIRQEMRIAARLSNTNRRCPKRIYRCPECGYWHLTSADRLVSS